MPVSYRRCEGCGMWRELVTDEYCIICKHEILEYLECSFPNCKEGAVAWFGGVPFCKYHCPLYGDERKKGGKEL